MSVKATDAPDPAQFRLPPRPSAAAWASARTLLSTLAVAGAVAAVTVSHSGVLENAARSLATAEVTWLAAATAGTVALWLAGTLSQLGAIPGRPPLLRLFEVQIAASFANHVLPGGVGGMAVNTRFLHRFGLTRAEAVGSVALNSAATGVTHALLLAGVLLLMPAIPAVGLPSAPPVLFGWPGASLVGTVVAVALTGGAAAALRRRHTTRGLPVERGTPRHGAELRGAAHHLVAVLRDPVRAAQLWGGSAAAAVIHGLVLAAALRSLTPAVPVIAVLAVYLAASAVSALLPSPGALGPLDIMLAASLASVHVPLTTAVAAVLGYRIATVWIPFLPSALVFLRLFRAGYI